jgi:Holliday junction DNA helicase RuvA
VGRGGTGRSTRPGDLDLPVLIERLFYSVPVISTLTGTVTALRLDSLVLEVGGLGFLVRTTPDALAGTRTGATLRLHTELVVREDSLTLFGFPSEQEAETFRIVQSVSGIGPRLALAVLAVLSPEDLGRAVAAKDTKAITRTPGIGPKVAGRMLLELEGKLAAPAVPDEATAEVPEPEDGMLGPVQAQVVEALVGLGWAEKQATKAVSDVDGEDEPGMDPAALLRAALRGLGGSR